MPITTRTFSNKAQLIISGLFDASCYQEFKHTSAMLIKNHLIENIEIDLSGTEYLDSAALGMLVQFNDLAKQEHKHVTLISVPGRVADVLKIVHAEKLFTINLPTGIKMNFQ